MNFDDLTDDRDEADDDIVTGATPQGSAPQAAPQPSFDELTDDRETEQPAMAGGEQAPTASFDDLPDDREASGGEWSQAGAAAAFAAKGAVPGVGGLAAGLQAGAAITAVAGPVAGVLGGLGVGLGAGTLLNAAQDKFLALMQWDKPLEEAKKAWPRTTDLAEMAPAAALLKPTGSMIQRGVGAAIGAGAEGGMQLINGEFDPGKILMAGGFGAALPSTNAAGSKIIASGDQIGERLSNKLYRGEGGRYRGGNKNPDLKEVPTEEGQPTETQAPQEDEITVANHEPNVAGGVAVEQGPAPEIPGVGNPDGAAGAQREAARPSDPERNYQKDQAQNQPTTTESKVIDTEPLKSDIKSALEGASGEQVPHTEGTDVLPEGAAPTKPRFRPLADEHADDVMNAESEGVRRAEANGRQGQEGEAFDALSPDEPVHDPAGADRPAAPVREQAPEAPEALSPEDAKRLAEDRKMLAQAGWDRALTALDKVAPRQQLEFLAQHGNEARKMLAEAEGKKKSEAEARRPDGELRKESRKKVGETGVLASSKADLERKTNAIKHYKDVYGEFGPGSEAGKAIDPLDLERAKDTRAYTKQVWNEVVKRFGGDPFAKGSGHYVPNQRTPGLTEAVQWIKAVRASAKNQNHKSFATLHSVEGLGDLDRQTGRVEGDIAHKPQINEAAEDTMTAGDAARDTARQPIEEFTDPDQMESKVYGDQQKKLRDWVNDLEDVDYQLIKGAHPELEQNIRATQDPAELHMNLMDDLEAAQKRRPKGELTSEVELPAKRVNAPELPQKGEPAPTGKVLDKNSDEFKRLAALYNEKAPQGPAKTKGEQLADLQAKREAATKAGHTIDTEAIDGTSEKAVRDQLVSFYKDESAGGKIGVGFLSKLFSKTNPSSPVADPGAVQYEQTLLPERLRSRQVEKVNLSVEIAANMTAANAKNSGVNAHDQRKIALADQNNKLGALPKELKEHYDTYTAPVRERAMQVMREYAELNEKEKLGHDLPNLNAVTTKAYQPRYQIDKQAFNRAESDAFDPFTGKGVGDYSPNLEDRNFFSLENGPERMVVEITKDKGVNIHRASGSVQKLKDIPASFDGKLGDTLDLNVKGKKGKWTVDQATTEEIEKATGLKYYENATYAWSKMLHDMTEALENAKMQVEIKNDPNFKKLSTTDREVAAERGWSTKVSTHLPQFATEHGKPLYMSDQMRWVFDDYHKPGFGGLTTEGIEKLRSLNTALLKVFNTNAPLVHVLNELDLFVVGRGFKWINPKAYYDLAVAAPKAYKSVNSQDHLQAEMRLAGVNPMLASVGMRTMWPDAVKGFGMEVIKNHSQWDPVAKVWGVSTKEIGQKLYDVSSDITWRLSDYLSTIRYLEEKANGHSNDEAAKRVNKFMSDYSLKTTVMGSRALQQIIADPASTGFGRFKAGLFRSLSGMTRDLLSPNATKQERIDALGQWLVMGALGYVLYPAADALVRKVSGNEGGELRRRGVTAIADATKNIATGEKDPAAMAARVWTPAPAISAAIDLKNNKEAYSGKSIVPQGEWPGVIPEAIGGLGEYAAKTLVPPYGVISQEYARPEGSAAGAAGAFLADQVGVGLPSDAGNKYRDKIEKVNAQRLKTLHKKPGGMIPMMMNRVTE